MNIILKHPRFLWHWPSISVHHNTTMDIIEKYPNKPWNWKYVSRNPNLTIEMLNKNKQWDWDWINNTSNIPVNDTIFCIKNNIHSVYDNISMDLINKYSYYYDWNDISKSTFEKDYKKFEFEKIYKYLMAYRIQQYWNKASADPYCSVGYNRIMRDYDKLILDYNNYFSNQLNS